MKKLLYIIPILFIGCTTPKEIIREVPVEVVKEVEKNVYVHDTTYTKDSVIVYQKGDTIFKEKIVYKYVGKTVHDTLITRDSIPVYLESETVITNTVKVPQWWPVWLMLGAIIAGFIIYIVLKFKTKFISIFKIFK